MDRPVVAHLEQPAIEAEGVAFHRTMQELEAFRDTTEHVRMGGTPVGLEPHADHRAAATADHQAGPPATEFVQRQQ